MRSGSWVLGPLLLLSLSMLLSYECKHHSSLKRLRHKLRISGGTKVSSYDFPSFVAIKIHVGNETGYCSGVMVDHDLMLTAAHCLRRENIGDIEILNSDITPEDWPKDGDRAPVLAEKICRSRTFNLPESQRAYNDFAVIKLSKPLRGVIPAHIARDHELQIGHDEPDYKTFALGIGKTSDDSSVSPLRALQVERVECAEIDDHRSKLCFTSCDSEHPGDACMGDSGGPILSVKGYRQIVYGLISYGSVGCPAGVSRVSVAADVYNMRYEIWDLMAECLGLGGKGKRGEMIEE